MSVIWLYGNKSIEKIVGDFYKTAGRFNGFQHVPDKSFLDRLLGPNAWYKSEFKKDRIESEIWEYRNGLALDSFLDSIEIKYDSQRVYFANVHRNDASIHINQKVCTDKEWVKKIIDLTKQYPN